MRIFSSLRKTCYDTAMRESFLPSESLPSQETYEQAFLAQEPTLLAEARFLAERIRDLSSAGESRALVVGGFVRDALCGLHPKDMDIEVYGVAPQTLEDLLVSLYPEKVNLVGKAFGILKVSPRPGIELDVSIPRRESKIGAGHRGFSIQGDPTMNVTEAARRRDFTMNALAADPLTGEVIDPFGAIEDLQRHVLRVTDPERFQDDPLRIYRAIQFCGRLGLRIDRASAELMREMIERGDLEQLPKERVTTEIEKLLLKSSRPSIGFEAMRELGLIESAYPELHALIGCEQEYEWHPEGDVWTHTMMVIDAAAALIRRADPPFSQAEKIQILLGSLCHDLGKPATTTYEEKDGVMRIRSLGHEEAGEEPARQLLARWMFPQYAEEAAIAVTKDHLKPSTLFRAWERRELDQTQYINAARKLIRRIHPISWRVLLASSEADSRGRAFPDADTKRYEPGLLFADVVRQHQLDIAPKQTLLQGRDLLALGVLPGKRLGELLRLVETARDEGLFSTKPEAIAWLQRESLL
jgi:tRNA nucleotidyltransferase (CCA-adding enzyme)